MRAPLFSFGSVFSRAFAMRRSVPILKALAVAAALCATGEALAYVVNIGTGTRAIYLQGGNGDAGVEAIPNGTFTGGTQTLTTFPVNTWRESCHTFSYANAANVASGTYTGRATYTLSAP